MRRRDFIGKTVAATALRPVAAQAQTQDAAKLRRIGILWHAASAEEEGDYYPVLVEALARLGYVDGKTIRLDHRFPAEQPERFRAMAKELIDSKVDAIVSVSSIGTHELKLATSTIPVVMVFAPDPVGSGFIQSLAHPGSNVTGLSLMVSDQSGKILSLLKDAMPFLSRVAVFSDPRFLANKAAVAAFERVAKAAGLAVSPVEVTAAEAIEPAFKHVTDAKADALIVPSGPMFFSERARIGSLALQYKLPTFVAIAEMVRYGALLSYGPDFKDYFRRAALYVDKILKGAKPADLPVEQPTRFILVLNQKVANTMGIIFSPLLLAEADEVIE